jgi:hypothetical protein
MGCSPAGAPILNFALFALTTEGPVAQVRERVVRANLGRANLETETPSQFPLGPLSRDLSPSIPTRCIRQHSLLGLVKQEVNMLRHDNVSVDADGEAAAHTFQALNK